MKGTMKEYFFEKNGLRTRYYVLGKGTPLFFLHGGGLEAKSYSRIIKELSKKYKVIAPDIPPFGKSGMPHREWSFVKYADYFEELVRELKLKEFILFGYSFGGGIALNLATRKLKVSKLILCNSTLATSYSKNGVNLIVLREAIGAIRSLKSLQEGILFLGIAKDFIRNVVKRANNIDALYSVVINSIKCDYKDLEKIKVPVIIIWSRKDPIFHISRAKMLMKKINKSKFIAVDGSHLWFLLRHKKAVGLIGRV